ncbi:fructose-1-phosphate kinase PfkB-like protein [Caldicoprobacter guelmensis]|uniref:hypothetical protein n=1 Tax=Caldicoprobacter guelmensis TaxID=1170224 RepID=UPI00195E5A2D|nr:hypothetical protein [Caldicoprobacter guelmensis]MBM7583366.1 fructose-1-phosphate kinase PfkB-like protein [Caldicoprobacter guelmensis]
MNPALDKVDVIDDFFVNLRRFNPQSITVTAKGKGLNVGRVARILRETAMETGSRGGGTVQFINKQLQERGIISKFVSQVFE